MPSLVDPDLPYRFAHGLPLKPKFGIFLAFYAEREGVDSYI